MKHLLLTTIAAVLVVGCGPSVDIHEAAEAGNIEAVKQAIANGVDVEVKDALWRSPLLIAAANGHKELTELLLAEGADVNAKDYRGRTPLDVAINFNKPEIVELLIDNGADVNAEREGGYTPLIYAAGSGGHKEIVELLIANGAVVNAFSSSTNFMSTNSLTPLHTAAYWGRKEITELFIANGADVNAKFEDGETPLDTAISRKHPETADLLRKHGGKTKKELKSEGK